MRAGERLAIERADLRFTRKQVRDFAGWGNTQIKIHLHRLEELEYLLVHRGGRGQSFVYEEASSLARSSIDAGSGNMLSQVTHQHGDTDTYAQDTTNALPRPSSITFAGVSCPAPAAPVITAAASVPANSTNNQASVPADNTLQYSWSITGGTITSATTAASIVYTAGASGSVVLSVTAANQCGTGLAGTRNVPIQTTLSPPLNLSATTQSNSSVVSLIWSQGRLSWGRIWEINLRATPPTYARPARFGHRTAHSPPAQPFRLKEHRPWPRLIFRCSRHGTCALLPRERPRSWRARSVQTDREITGQVDLVWGASAGADYYEINRSTLGGNPYRRPPARSDNDVVAAGGRISGRRTSRRSPFPRLPSRFFGNMTRQVHSESASDRRLLRLPLPSFG